MIWRVGVVGDPVSHSRSPQLQEIGLKSAGLTGTSTRVQLPADRGHELTTLLGSSYDALSVTMPLKSIAWSLCATLTPAAQRLGVVNSIRYVDGHIEGHCTDGEGFVASVLGEFAFFVRGATVVILGSGGSATAIADALVDAGAASVSVIGRNASTVEKIVSRYPGVATATLPTAPIDLLINTIPAANRPPEEPLVPGVTPSTIAVDITYDPILSPWRASYDALGCRTGNGLAMLAYQAVVQMQWWWGVSLDGHQLLEAIS